MNPKFNNSLVDLVLKSVALLTVQLESIEELEKHKVVFYHKTKEHGNNFKKCLERNIKDFYVNFKDEHQIESYKDINKVIDAVNSVKMRFGDDLNAEEVKSEYNASKTLEPDYDALKLLIEQRQFIASQVLSGDVNSIRVYENINKQIKNLLNL